MELQVYSDLHVDVAPVKKITIANDVDVVNGALVVELEA